MNFQGRKRLATTLQNKGVSCPKKYPILYCLIHLWEDHQTLIDIGKSGNYVQDGI